MLVWQMRVSFRNLNSYTQTFIHVRFIVKYVAPASHLHLIKHVKNKTGDSMAICTEAVYIHKRYELQGEHNGTEPDNKKAS